MENNDCSCLCHYWRIEVNGRCSSWFLIKGTDVTCAEYKRMTDVLNSKYRTMPNTKLIGPNKYNQCKCRHMRTRTKTCMN